MIDLISWEDDIEFVQKGSGFHFDRYYSATRSHFFEVIPVPRLSDPALGVANLPDSLDKHSKDTTTFVRLELARAP